MSAADDPGVPPPSWPPDWAKQLLEDKRQKAADDPGVGGGSLEETARKLHGRMNDLMLRSLGIAPGCTHDCPLCALLVQALEAENTTLRSQLEDLRAAVDRGTQEIYAIDADRQKAEAALRVAQQERDSAREALLVSEETLLDRALKAEGRLSQIRQQIDRLRAVWGQYRKGTRCAEELFAVVKDLTHE